MSVAHQIERRFPQLGERLSSGVAFAARAENDPRGGSAALRRAVVAEADALAADLDFTAALDMRAPRRAAAIAALVFAGVGLVAGLYPRRPAWPLLAWRCPGATSPGRGDMRWPSSIRHRLAAGDDPGICGP